MDLRFLFSPESIAVVGASADPRKLSYLPLQYLVRHGYRGRLCAVNPRAGEILGVRSYPSLGDVPDGVDLALLLVPAEGVLETLAACQRKGVRSAILFGSGFAEAGEVGAREQARIQDLLRQGTMRLIGPNCMGVCNVREGVAATFSQSMHLPSLRAGRVAFVGQSGAVGGSVLNLAQDRGLGFSLWATTGNEADLSAVEVARAMAADAGTDVICLYVEHLQSGEAYLDLLRFVRSQGKELVVLKSGRSEVGSRSALSHTGKLARTDLTFDQVSRQGGAHVVYDIEEMLDVALALAQAPPAAGNRLGVVTTSGGAGILIADHADAAGLKVPPLDEQTRAGLAAMLPPFAALQNPVDVTAQLFTTWQQGKQGAYRDCFAAVAGSAEVDQLTVALTMIVGEPAVRLAHEVAEAAASIRKPLLVTWLAGELARDAFAVLRDAGIPLYPSASRCMRAARALVEAGRPRPPLPTPTRRASRLARPVWTEADLQPLLQESGIAVPASLLVRDREEAVRAAERIGYPVVLKVQSPEILHKTEHGGVVTGLRSGAAVRRAFDGILQRAEASGAGSMQGILVQRQVNGTAELLVAVRSDPDFGHLLVLGLGGTAVEIYKDIAVRCLPVTAAEIEAMLLELKAYPLLNGHRGRPAVDRRALVNLVLRVADLAASLGSGLGELEFNPVIAGPDGAWVADALLVSSGNG
jgi:acetate---CoA ligase (ADP-forming)